MLLRVTELYHGFSFQTVTCPRGHPRQPLGYCSLGTGICHRQTSMVSNSLARDFTGLQAGLVTNPNPPLLPRHGGPAPRHRAPFRSQGAQRSPRPAAPGILPGGLPRPRALPGGTRLLPVVPGRGWGLRREAPGGAAGGRRFRVGRRCLPTPRRAGPAHPGRTSPAGRSEEGDAGTHLAPGPRPARRMGGGGSPGSSRRRSPERAGGPRPPRARSPRRGLRCQQTTASLPPAGPPAPEAPTLSPPRKHRPARNARAVPAGPPCPGHPPGREGGAGLSGPCRSQPALMHRDLTASRSSDVTSRGAMVVTPRQRRSLQRPRRAAA